ncbi:MAG: ASPIC/UnbV domain-containing protein [Myxococcota bacterium]
MARDEHHRPVFSLSGYERDRLFLQDERGFTDVSLHAGVDHPGDSRASAPVDVDRDGRLDLAVTHANAPRFSLFGNRLVNAGEFVAIRLVGGRNADRRAGRWSNRDAIGARVTIETEAGARIVRERRAGQGFAAQQSSTLLVGIGRAPAATSVTVRWPSGRVSEQGHVGAGTLLTVFEHPEDGPAGRSSTVESYNLDAGRRGTRTLSTLSPALPSSPPGKAKVQLVVASASWCAACRRAYPRLRAIRAAFGADEVALWGVAVDESDALFARYTKAAGLPLEPWSPPFDTVRLFGADVVLPSSAIIAADGRVLERSVGVPSISKLRRWLDEIASGGPRGESPRGG